MEEDGVRENKLSDVESRKQVSVKIRGLSWDSCSEMKDKQKRSPERRKGKRGQRGKKEGAIDFTPINHFLQKIGSSNNAIWLPHGDATPFWFFLENDCSGVPILYT